jgi:pyruvate/2-oxoglutarate/acetoin dehydrogenase E1 component/TPP-dependent pyruvate/acetoin dehydrogenase alpha subunit
MSTFRNREHLYGVIGSLFEKAKREPSIRQELVKGDLIVRFRFADPDAEITVDLRGDDIAIHQGHLDLEPDVEFSSSADDAHLFWLGRLSLMRAIATRRVIARGSVPKALGLLPAIEPLFSMYPTHLSEIGEAGLLTGEEIRPKKKPLKAVRNWLSGLRAPSVPERGDGSLQGISFTEEETKETPIKSQELPTGEEELKIEMLRRMILIREFEQRLGREFAQGTIPSEALHLSIGQEACAVGACFALQKGDTMSTTHRGHGHMIAMGADLRRMAAEIFGKATGLCRGLGGPMHVSDASLGALGANGIVGASTLISTGAGLASLLRDRDQVSLTFLGDGATAHGMFHEAVNLAAVFDLPVIFFVENNQYAEFTAAERHTRLERIADRAHGYGIPGLTVDGNHVWEVYRAVGEAVERARNGEGPTILEGVTYRWSSHSEGDTVTYRSQEEIEAWMGRDPILRWKDALIQAGLLQEARFDALQEDARAKVEVAVQFACNSPEPDAEELFTYLYAPEPRHLYAGSEKIEAGRELTVSAAINEALAEEMARDDRVYLIGEDVSLGGYFVVTAGLVDVFGPERVIDTPISEYAIVGSSVGAAMTGMRPVAEIEFSDFITCCMDPLVNQAAKLRFMSGGQVRIPMVVRMPGGSGLGMAAQHSQSLEAWLLNIPGLILIAPSDAYDAKGLLKAAIRSNNPVVFFENKLLYLQTGPVPEEPYLVPIGKAEVKRRGRDLTLIAVGAMVSTALEAAREVQSDGTEVEVIDPRTLSPCDWETINGSVWRTRRAMILEGGPLTGGFGAECVARVSKAAWRRLRAPVKRIAALDLPIPYNRNLENTVVPDVDRVTGEIRQMLQA